MQAYLPQNGTANFLKFWNPNHATQVGYEIPDVLHLMKDVSKVHGDIGKTG